MYYTINTEDKLLLGRKNTFRNKWIMQKIQSELSGENFPSESYRFKYKVYSCRWFTINLICR